MGLDVTLCQFSDLDAEAILEFARFAYDPSVLKPNSGVNLKAKARELGLPESILPMPYFGGERISFPSKKYPEWPPVGDWSSFRMTREIMEHFTGRNIYFVFPEAVGDPPLFRPDWTKSRRRLAEILEELQHVTPAQMEDYHAQFVLAEIAPLIERWKSVPRATAAQIFTRQLAQIEVMIETLDYVINHERPREFLLRWSA